MINYYKILDLDNYASIAEVKEAYRSKIKRLHPDVNKDDDAEEITQYLNQAKDQLSTIELKDQYDRRLKLAYLTEIQRLQGIQQNQKPTSTLAHRRETHRRRALQRKIKIKERYEKGLIKFPLSLRIMGLVTLTMWGLQLFYSHYFVYYGGQDFLYIILGFGVFTTGASLSANALYTHYLCKSVDLPLSFNYEIRVAKYYILLLILGIFGVTQLNEYRKSYHLENNYAITLAIIDYKYSDRETTVVDYNVGNKYYRKKIRGNSMDISIAGNHVLLKYAYINPLICEAIDPSQLELEK